MNPETGEGFDAVQVGDEEYFDPNAQDPEYPQSVGLTIRKKTYWQGDVEFETFDTVGPKFGPVWPNGTLRVGGVGTDTDVWGLSEKDPPGPGYAPWLHNGVTGGPGGQPGTPLFTTTTTGPGRTTIGLPFEWTPCFEDNGEPTMAEADSSYIDITLMGAYGGDIKFPVMPEEFGADFTHEYWTPSVVGLGEIVMPGGQAMETISWDSFFPSNWDPTYCCVTMDELEDPKSVTARLIWTMRFKMNCFLIVGGGIWNDQVVITSFNYRHKAGEPFDIYYSITLKRYRAPVVTTAPNPDALSDRWYKDPRHPGAAATPPDEATAPVEPANPEAVDVTPDPPPVTVPFDQAPSVSPTGRESLITKEVDTIRPTGISGVNIQGLNIQGLNIEGANIPVEQGETFEQAVGRLSKAGPNTIENMLPINQWVTDNGYNIYTSPLPVGAGVYYFKETPVDGTAQHPLTYVTPTDQVYYPGTMEPQPTTPGLPSRFNPNGGGLPTTKPSDTPYKPPPSRFTS
jgi:hypothetical protein